MSRSIKKPINKEQEALNQGIAQSLQHYLKMEDIKSIKEQEALNHGIAQSLQDHFRPKIKARSRSRSTSSNRNLREAMRQSMLANSMVYNSSQTKGFEEEKGDESYMPQHPRIDFKYDPNSINPTEYVVIKPRKFKNHPKPVSRSRFSFFTKKNKRNTVHPRHPKGSRFSFFTKKHKVQPMIMNPYFLQNKI